MPRIKETIEINASIDRTWEIISDLDGEPTFWWGTKKVENISREGNVIDREIYQNFGNHPILQKVILNPKTEIEIQYLKGVTLGVKRLRLNQINEGTQNLTADWDIHFPGFYWLATPFVARHVRKGTKDALQRIKGASEGIPVKSREEIAKGNKA